MTGETLAGLGSSAAILYYNDFVTYPDNTTEPTDLLLAPLPHAAGTATPLMPQAGVGLCAFKTTDQKAEAAAVAPAALAAFVREAIGPVRTPKTLHVVAALPRNPVGKVVRGEVKSLIYPAPQ